MIQNILALSIVTLTFAYVGFSIYRSVASKKVSKCDGCSGCDLKRSLHPSKQSSC